MQENIILYLLGDWKLGTIYANSLSNCGLKNTLRANTEDALIL